MLSEVEPVGQSATATEPLTASARSILVETVETVNEQLNNLLLFTALLSAINSAFLVYTLPNLSSGPGDETNALLREILQTMNNTTSTSPSTPESDSRSVLVNQLWSASLTLSLLASFGAILGKQWLTNLRNSPSSSPAHIRNVLASKVVGAERWHVRSLLESGLSTTVEIALVIFIVGLILFFDSINKSVAWVNFGISCGGAAILLLTTVFALWDPSCPFQTPLTTTVIPNIFTFVFVVIGTIVGAALLPLVVVVGRVITAAFSHGTWIRDTFEELAYRCWKFLTLQQRSVSTVQEGWLQGMLFGRLIRRLPLETRFLRWTLENTDDPEVAVAAARAIAAIKIRKQLDEVMLEAPISRLQEHLLRCKTAQDPRDRFTLGRAIVHLLLSASRDEFEMAHWLRFVVFRDIMEDWDAVVLQGQAGPDCRRAFIAGAIKLLLDHQLYYELGIWSVLQDQTGDDYPALAQRLYDLPSDDSTPDIPLLVSWAMKTLPQRFPAERTGWSVTSEVLYKRVTLPNLRAADYGELWELYVNRDDAGKVDGLITKNTIDALNLFMTTEDKTRLPNPAQLAALLSAVKKQLGEAPLDLEMPEPSAQPITLPEPSATSNAVSTLTNETNGLASSYASRLSVAGGVKSLASYEAIDSLIPLLGTLHHSAEDDNALPRLIELVDLCPASIPLQDGTIVVLPCGRIIQACGEVLRRTSHFEENGWIRELERAIFGLLDRKANLRPDQRRTEWIDEALSAWRAPSTSVVMARYRERLQSRSEEVETFLAEYAGTLGASVDSGLAKDVGEV